VGLCIVPPHGQHASSLPLFRSSQLAKQAICAPALSNWLFHSCELVPLIGIYTGLAKRSIVQPSSIHQVCFFSPISSLNPSRFVRPLNSLPRFDELWLTPGKQSLSFSLYLIPPFPARDDVFFFYVPWFVSDCCYGNDYRIGPFSARSDYDASAPASGRVSTVGGFCRGSSAALHIGVLHTSLFLCLLGAAFWSPFFPPVCAWPAFTPAGLAGVIPSYQ